MWKARNRPDLLAKGKKDENVNLLSNNWPIALLSHDRKIIEIALDKVILRTYMFQGSQLGLQRNKGTKLALLHAGSTYQSCSTGPQGSIRHSILRYTGQKNKGGN